MRMRFANNEDVMIGIMNEKTCELAMINNNTNTKQNRVMYDESRRELNNFINKHKDREVEIAEKLLIHKEVLLKVKDLVPDKAKKDIELAINKSEERINEMENHFDENQMEKLKEVKEGKRTPECISCGGAIRHKLNMTNETG